MNRPLALLLLFWIVQVPAFAQTYEGWLGADSVQSGGDIGAALRAALPGRIAGLLERGGKAVAPGECFPMYGPYISLRAGKERTAESLADLESSSVVAVLGRVLSVEPGLYRDIFGQRVTIKITKSKGLEGRGIAGEEIRVFYPKGPVRFGPYCVLMANPDLPDPPKIGDRILAVSLLEPEELASEGLLVLYHDGFFIEREGSERIDAPLRWVYDTDISQAKTLESMAAAARLFGGQ